jgi:hypothetical protein
MSGQRHEQRIRTSDSNRRLLDLWPDLYGAGGFEMDGGAVLVLVESDVAMLAYLGHNAIYILTALICFRWLKHEEEESTTADEHARDGYNIAGLLFFFLFLDNLFRHIEGQGWAAFGRAQGESRWWSCMPC